MFAHEIAVGLIALRGPEAGISGAEVADPAMPQLIKVFQN
jgi:hypothetical protein